ncbi:hypothetical protein Tco_0062168, partial [Tanacetum coccineum]
YIDSSVDVIHVDNSSDLALSTSLNDLEIAALHIDGQSIDVDAPPDIFDVVDEDDDIIKNDQYILTTQVKQCFYLEDMARRPLG